MLDEVQSAADVKAERERRFWREADEAAGALETAFELAGIPPLASLTANVTSIGGHVYLGGVNVRTARLLAAWITAHALCSGAVVLGSVEPSRALPAPVGAGQCAECDRLTEQDRAALLTGDRERRSEVRRMRATHERQDHRRTPSSALAG